MERDISCFRCNTKMRFAKREHIQLGEYGSGLLGGAYSNFKAGAMLVDIYICLKCKKLEFFSANEDEFDLEFDEEDESESDEEEFLQDQYQTYGEWSGYDRDELPQKKCPNCGEWHDFDYPKCPFCKYKYEEYN